MTVLLILVAFAVVVAIYVRRVGSLPINAELQRMRDIELEESTLERLRQIALTFQRTGEVDAVKQSITEMFTDGTPLPDYLKSDMELADLIEAIEGKQAERAEELMMYVERAEQVGAAERN